MNSILVCYPNHTPTTADVYQVITGLFAVSEYDRLYFFLSKEGGGYRLYYGKEGQGTLVFADDSRSRMSENCRSIIDDTVIC